MFECAFFTNKFLDTPHVVSKLYLRTGNIPESKDRIPKSIRPEQIQFAEKAAVYFINKIIITLSTLELHKLT